MQSDADHINKRNYDDFNEFFWSTNCLQYRYSCDDPSELRLDVEDPNDRVTAPLLGSSLVPIAVGMMNAPKTFLEKRSWLRGIMAFNRIIDWHIVTFYLLSILAFSCDLVWGWVYTLQAASGVFWILNSLAIFWELLEVWASYPGIHLGGDAIFGSVFVLVARFIVLTNQTLYLIWTFSLESDSPFWWWQFVWLSLPCMIPYILQTMVIFLPAVSTTILTSRNEYVQSSSPC
jgi:callose synthase